MKPTPPDQERIELIINGDDPESHRAAQETARILSAPQVARAIQKRIDDHRKQIGAALPLFLKCRSFVENTKNITNYMPVSMMVSGGDIVGVVPTEHTLTCVDIVFHIWNVWDSTRELLRGETTSWGFKFERPMDRNELHKLGVAVRTIAECHDQIAKLLTDHISRLQEEIKQDEVQFKKLMAFVAGE